MPENEEIIDANGTAHRLANQILNQLVEDPIPTLNVGQGLEAQIQDSSRRLYSFEPILINWTNRTDSLIDLYNSFPLLDGKEFKTPSNRSLTVPD